MTKASGTAGRSSDRKNSGNNVPQFFVKEEDINGNSAVIRGDDCHHLVNVRRVKTGDLLRLRSVKGKGYIARITETGSEEISLMLLDEIESGEEPVNISLYMALIKGGNFEFVLQKGR